MTTYVGLTPEEWGAIWRTVQFACAGVLLSLPVSLALGWLLARKRFLGKTLLEAFVNFPLVLPPVITGYILLVLLGRRGLIGGWLWNSCGIQIAFGPPAAIVTIAVIGTPLLVRAVRLAFQGIDPRLFQAARSLGAGPFDAFISVSLPLARNGVIAGVVLAFARGLGEFGATLVFYGNPESKPTLALQFFNTWESQVGSSGEQRLWHLVGASLILACTALCISEYLERRGQRRESA